MKIYDAHMHSYNVNIEPETLLASLEKAGVEGCCVFSNRPVEATKEIGTPFESRLAEVLKWSKGYEDRIIPVLWIHPYEENIIEKIHIAVDAGVAAFKIICTDFYIYEDKPMEVMREIARLGKPVFFHSGCLWDGNVSSKYNRPLNFEPLLAIDGLRFSLGHCGWPWMDECIGLYGKFLHALHSGRTCEMFLDITPGTPEIDRRYLLTKLYALGYDVGDNVFFGSDGTAGKYRHQWTSFWLDVDRKILDDLGVSQENREKLYYGNMMRFLGKSDTVVEKDPPCFDDSRAWSPINPEVEVIIRKWYEKLNFPKVYDKEFYKALKEIPVSDAISIDSYDLESGNGKRNLLSFLFLCEGLSKKYAQLGIPEEILMATLQDIVSWTRNWSNVKGELFLGELPWLSRHFQTKIFRLGRLQFCMAEAHGDIPAQGLRKGDPVLEVHIPFGPKLTMEEVERSFAMAKEFFPKYFPDFDYKCFTCHSWMLDEKLKDYLPQESNILKFADLFAKYEGEDNNALLRFIFRWDTHEENLPYAVCNNDFAAKIKKAVMGGERFSEVLGVIPR